jgi:hypothetical protein
MDKLSIGQYSEYIQLPLDKFETMKFAVYALDKEWNYLFVNDFVKSSLGERGKDMVGKNIWALFPELVRDPSFQLIKLNSEKGLTSNMIIVSPITGMRQNIVGHVLEDCFLFYATILPNKADLMNELRNELGKK